MQQEELPIQIGNISVSFGEGFEVNSSAKSGSLISQGDVVGNKLETKIKVIDCQPFTHDLAKYMVCADGEIVKQGAVLAKISSGTGLFEKIITAPIGGKISYEAITDSLILIRQEVSKIRVEAFHSGILVQILHNQGYVTNTDYYAIPVSLSTPGDFRGVMVKEGYAASSFPKILLLEDLKKLSVSLEELLADRVVCLVATAGGYDDYLAFVEQYQRQLHYVGLVMLEEFGIEPAREVSSAIHKAIGRFVNIGEHQLKLPLGSYTEKIKYYNADVIASTAGFVKANPPKIGDKIRLISYFRTVPYARIEKVNFSAEQVLVNTSHTVEEAYLDNIILY